MTLLQYWLRQMYRKKQTGHRNTESRRADLLAHNEIFVHASCKKVFTNLADAQAWPSWYPNSHDVTLKNSLDGRLHRETRFSWDTFGVHIESTVHEFVPYSRLSWFGNATAMKA